MSQRLVISDPDYCSLTYFSCEHLALTRNELEIEGKPRRGENHSVPRPSKKKKKKAFPAAALAAVLAVVIAGGVGAGAWVRSRKPHGTSTNSVAQAGINTNRETPSRTNLLDLEAFVADIPDRTNAADLMNDGTRLLETGHVREAAACYERVLELKPEDEETHFNLGAVYARLNQLALAERHYREALRLFSDYAEAHNNLGNLLTKQKRYAEAVQEFQEAARISPEYALAQNNWGRALAAQGSLAEALTHFSEAVRLDTNYLEAHYNLGQTYLEVGRTNDAIAEFDTALKIRPDFRPALQALSPLRSRR